MQLVVRGFTLLTAAGYLQVLPLQIDELLLELAFQACAVVDGHVLCLQPLLEPEDRILLLGDLGLQARPALRPAIDVCLELLESQRHRCLRGHELIVAGRECFHGRLLALDRGIQTNDLNARGLEIALSDLPFRRHGSERGDILLVRGRTAREVRG